LRGCTICPLDGCRRVGRYREKPGGVVRVDVGVDGGESELRSLYGWLRQDVAVRMGARIVLPQPQPRAGEMGSVADVVQLVTENGWSAASFVLALSTWRQTRPVRPKITVQRGGTTVTVEGGTDEELLRIVALLEGGADGDGEQ
jgi:hypothetical protein